GGVDMGLKKVTLAQVKASVKKNKSWNGYVAPNKVAEFHVNQGWHLGVQINVMTNDNGDLFVGGQHLLTRYLENFQYHNCNNEVGTGVAYWELTS
ncbi:hypothetical protein P4488_17880, partial [Bacillus thuringiensis]|nr:hypothetical protein [Bacillus thuringiensis]